MREGDEVNVENNTYILKELLGQGSYGKVFKAFNKRTQQIAAIKIQDSINEDELKVLNMMRKKTHKNLINILNFERVSRKYFIVMEYCRESLYDRIIRRGTIQSDEVRFIMKEIGNGIKEIHELGYAHRDLKPENILIFQVNDNGQTQDLYKICDFGTIKQIDVLKTQKVGTAYYLAPEQVNGYDSQYSQKVDIWAFGALIYELLTGTPLFNGKSEQEVWIKIKNTTQKSIDEQIKNNLKIERKYSTLLLNMLQTDIGKRYDINQVVSDLRGTSQPIRKTEFQGQSGRPDGRVFDIKGLPNPNQLQHNYASKLPGQEQQIQKADPIYSRGRNIEQSESPKRSDYRSPQMIKTSDNTPAIRATNIPLQLSKQSGPIQTTSSSQDTKYSQMNNLIQNTTFNQNQPITKLPSNLKIENYLQNNSQKQNNSQTFDQYQKNPFQQQQQQQPFQNQIPVQAQQNQLKSSLPYNNNQQFDEQQQSKNTNQKLEAPIQGQAVKRTFGSSQLGSNLQNATQKQQPYDQQQKSNNTIEQQSGKILNQPALAGFSNQQYNNPFQNTNQKQQSFQQQQNNNTIEQQSGKNFNQAALAGFPNQQYSNLLQNTNQKQQSVQQQQNNNTIEQQSGKNFNYPAPAGFPNQQDSNLLQNTNQKQQSNSSYNQQQQNKNIFQQQQGTTQNNRASQPSQNLQNNYGNFIQNTNYKQQSVPPQNYQLQNKNNIIQKEETIEQAAAKNPSSQFLNSSQFNTQKQGRQQPINRDDLLQPQNINSSQFNNTSQQQQNISQNRIPQNGNYFQQTNSNSPQQPQSRLSTSQNQNNQPQKQIFNPAVGQRNASNFKQSNQAQVTPGQSGQYIQSSFGNNPYQQHPQKIGQFNNYQ